LTKGRGEEGCKKLPAERTRTLVVAVPLKIREESDSKRSIEKDL